MSSRRALAIGFAVGAFVFFGLYAVDAGAVTVQAPEAETHVIGSRDAAQWLACLAAFTLGHLVAR